MGKALGLSLDRVDALAKTLDGYHARADELAEPLREAGFDPDVAGRPAAGRRWCGELLGFPAAPVAARRRHGDHAAARCASWCRSRTPPCRTAPSSQWDKDDLDALGILKVDCLALGMLTAIRKCFDLVAAASRPAADAGHACPPEDPAVYDMICRADTIGVFQIESRAQMSMLPRLQAADASTTW